ncbi:helix-turn-helix domain-containing protein [Tenacibaculum sp. 1B UA]|uniref:helix-turn-helix domain-containing protein n=1 Tax=Tenacibaculum sp. 1B UA TaxID=2922252 RepID=UPI002A249478|nr:helix-turn-helix domain-containing protein [Tenacibaculum sp. 1B UA]MDX8553398.1 helix-turn-helix domain-containing protein [Tenacibaculum sp. 1B UA]
MKEKIQKYDFKEGLPQEFEIIDFDLLFNEFSEEIKKPHRAEFYQILWFQKGSPTHFVDFNPIKIKPNSLLFVNKNSVQIFDNKTKFKGKAILFTDSFFCKTETDTKFLRSSILFNDLLSISQIELPKNNSIIETVFELLETELKNSKDNYQSDLLRNDLRNLLLHSERERRKQDFKELKKDANLEQALYFKTLLDDNFVRHKRVSFYCQELNITPKRLNQSTSKIFGKTPKNIIDDRVLLESKRLLAHTSESIKEISFSLGYEELTNFIKYFKKHTNKTPVEFRAEFNVA